MLRRRRPFSLTLPGTDVATVTDRVQALRPPRVSRTLPPHEVYARTTADGTVRVTRPAGGGPWSVYGYPGLRGRLTSDGDGVTLAGEARESALNVFVDALMWTVSLAALLFTTLAFDPPLFGPSPGQIVLGGLGTAVLFALVGLATHAARRGFSRDVDDLVARFVAALAEVSPR